MDEKPSLEAHDDEVAPPTMRSPISTLQVRDHAVAVEVRPLRPVIARIPIRPRLRSNLFPTTRVA